ncbi:MAG TPA: ATP-binding protein, partial [Candidatus Methanoperedens sp.]|nr:ATP-binding protein [Candidatus Methanoperedens sp.]
LHRAVALFGQGRHAQVETAAAAAEIADLSREFDAMSLALRDREERLSEEKERLTVTLRSIGDGVIVTDADGRVTLLNRVGEELTGWTSAEAVGRPFCEIFAITHEKTREPCENIVGRVLATGGVVSLANHTALTRRDGRRIVIEDAAAPIRDRESQIIGVVLVFRDVTEKQRMEAELLKTEKLQALGVLAGGIAHDFNNLLTGVLGGISLAKLGLAPADPARARLEEADAAARRAAELTSQLLTFSRGGAPIRKAAAIGEILRESVGFILSGTSVAAEFAIAPGLWTVEVDAGQMNQVFNNLTLNAVQAMPSGGKIAFTAQNVALASGDVPTLAAGDYVRISVRDEGAGIAPEDLARVFDPYFTTRPDGAGLGLTSVYSIVKRHDGDVTVASAPGGGTTIRVYLPATHTAPLPASSQGEEIVPGRGPVLVMDDEEFVRSVAAEILRTLGYTPVTAEDGDRALELYRRASERGEPFRAVIMDLTIPGGVGGKEAVGRLLAIDPKARVIVSSGYSNDPVMARYPDFGFKGVILKPYSVGTFSRVLHEVLAGEG